ncbi:family 20 glycosylhydrolase [Levilactobacillus spicheri]|nr:family 20 glycosylhydrolase [Levilactobacillus spicheri]
MHRWHHWLLMGLLVTGLGWGPSLPAQAASHQTKGLILDAARQYYSVASLKRLITTVHRGGGTFLQLHLTDDSRFGVENARLGQTVAAAHKRGDVYYNRRTGLAFLSKRQLRSLVVYGHQRKVEVIPEIDTPGHTRALIKLMKTSSAANRQLAATITHQNELTLHAKQTLPFVKSLLGEYTGLLYRGQHLAIGGDEYSASTQATQPTTVSYTNDLNRYLRGKGLKTTMWNDGLMKADLRRIDHNIRVVYWSYDGETGNSQTAKAHRQIRATLPELNRAGFQTLNANFWYLYVITRPATFKAANVRYWQNDLKRHWTPTVWDKTSHQNLATSKRNLGSAISIWGDGKKTYSQQQVLAKTKPFLDTYFKQ